MFFLFSNFFYVFIFNFFFLVFQITFYGHPIGDMEVALSQKRQEIQKISSPISAFSIFEAVWRSRDFERLYIDIFIYIIIRANFRPPCRRYRGGSSTKKIDNTKIEYMCFFVFRYLKPFSAHATLNISLYRYIYVYCIYIYNKSQFTATLQEIQRWLFQKKNR